MPTRGWRHTGAAAAAIVLVIAGARLAPAQTLGELARRTEDDRKKATTGRVYTNEALEAVDPPAAPPAAPAVTPAAAAPPSSQGEKDSATGQTNAKPAAQSRVKRDEQYWRKLFTDLRARVARANADLDAARARLNGIQGDESPEGVRQREVLVASITRLENGVRIQTEELTRYLTRAGVANVPEEWTR